MATVDELTTRLATLQAQRASGVAEIQVDGRTIRYRTDTEIAAAIADLERQLAASTTSPVTTILVAATKGLDA